ncbi:MAG: peptidoglycan DD-metalloendopeptidase family protein [Oceanospirillaceae bacterium]
MSDLSSVSINSKKYSSNQKRKSPLKLPNNYKVKRGDTLYSIAWKYGLDFKLLAKRNNISSNYIIYKDQVLSIKGRTSNSKPSVAKTTLLNKAKPSLTRVANSDKTRIEKTPSDLKRVKKPDQKNKQHKPIASKATRTRWQWPAKGTLITKFSKENKGLDISGVKGSPVRAAASGKVVYAGNGIIGYGNLIIIKHSQEYLSAYAHNSVLLVSEGMKIKAGRKIGEIGSSGTIKTLLHFEIRKDGKPVNPLNYLPK